MSAMWTQLIEEFKSRLHTYSEFLFDERSQVTISHERQDNHRLFLESKAETKQAQDVRVIEILHNNTLLNKVLNSFLVQIRIYALWKTYTVGMKQNSETAEK